LLKIWDSSFDYIFHFSFPFVFDYFWTETIRSGAKRPRASSWLGFIFSRGRNLKKSKKNNPEEKRLALGLIFCGLTLTSSKTFLHFESTFGFQEISTSGVFLGKSASRQPLASNFEMFFNSLMSIVFILELWD